MGRQFEPGRAVEITSPKYGSGYRIGGRLVLTAAHPLTEVGAACRVRAKQSFGEVEAVVVWKAEGWDIALIELPESVPLCDPVVLGQLPEAHTGEKLPFQMYGYPLWGRTQRDEGKSAAGGRQIEGIIYLADRSPDGLLVLEVQRLPPEATTERSEWEGASGSAIVCDGLVIAVQSQHQNPKRPASLEAELLANIYDEEQWRALLKQHNINPEPVYVALTQGERTQLVYSSSLPDVSYFQGRQAELMQLKSWLQNESTSMVGIRGEGGIGKSTLAAKAFKECSGFQSKCWIDVRTGTSTAELSERALQEFGMPSEQVKAIDKKDLEHRLLRQLQTGRFLLAIDNLESVLTSAGNWQSNYGEFLDAFSEAGRPSVLLLASREFQPGYFGWRHSQWLTVQTGLDPKEGAALLQALEVEGSEEERAKVSKLIEGNPLALSLLAGWVRHKLRKGERSVLYLEQYLDLFDVKNEHRGEKRISVQQVFDWSFSRLTESTQQLLCQISVLRGGFNVQSAGAVAQRTLEEAELDDLERRSLLQRLPSVDKYGQREFRLQPRVQDFARKKLATEASISAHKQASEYFWARRKTQFEPNDDINAAAEYLEAYYHEFALKHYQEAAQKVLACDAFLSRRGYSRVLVDCYERLYKDWQPSQKQRKKYAAVCRNLGNAYRSLGQFERAIKFHQKALEIARELGDRYGESLALGHLGSAHFSLGKNESAIEFYQQSLEIAYEIGDLKRESTMLGKLGDAYILRGQLDRALEFLQRNYKLACEIGDRQEEATALGYLGKFYHSCGELNRAVEFHQKYYEITKEIGYRRGQAIALGYLGNVYQSLGQFDRAIELHQQSLEISHEIGYCKGEVNAFGNLGRAYHSLGQFDRAIEFHQQSLDIAHEIGDLYGEAKGIYNKGRSFQAIQRHIDAIYQFQLALTIYQKLKQEDMVKRCEKLIVASR